MTVHEVRARLLDLPRQFVEPIEVIQFSAMTRKRKLFPCYGMQWGPNVYLYPIEESLVETYYQPPKPQQLVEARMFGGVWSQVNGYHLLTWTEQAIKDFYLNNVLSHEIGHVTARHAAQQYTRQIGGTVGLVALGVFVPAAEPFSQASQQAMGLLFLKYGRDDELQADSLGVRYAGLGNWDPEGVPSRVPEQTFTAGGPRTFLATLGVHL